MALVYHGISIAYGGDSAIQDKDTWIANWVSLVKHVLQSDACEVRQLTPLLASPTPIPAHVVPCKSGVLHGFAA